MQTEPQFAVVQGAVTMINPELGPFLSRLPDELLIYIFTIVATTLFPPTSRLLNPEIGVNPDTFAILNRHSALKRIRNVSKTFCAFFMQAFYENLYMVCSTARMPLVRNTRAPLTPPVQMRHFLRTLRVEIILHSSYCVFEPFPGVPGREMRRDREFESAEHLMQICPAARALANLTDSVSGFCNLSHLDLFVGVNCQMRPLDDAFIRVLEEANFTVKAKKVTLTVINYIQPNDEVCPHYPLPQVQELITVVETG